MEGGPVQKEGLTVIGLVVEKVKRIDAIDIHPEAVGLVKITGENAQGKSTVLDSIHLALSPSSADIETPVQRGAKAARVILDLGEIKVVRRWTSSGSVLEVYEGDRAVKKPQTFLDSLIGAGIGFDPVGWCRDKTDEQVHILLKLTGLDPMAAEQERQAAYQLRADANRELKRLQAVIDKLPMVAPDTPDEEVSTAEIEQKLAELQKLSDIYQTQEAKLLHLQEEIARWQREVERLSAELQQAQTNIANAQSHENDLRQRLHGLVRPDATQLAGLLARAAATNEAVRLKRQRTELEEQLFAQQLEAAVQQEKLDALAEAERTTVAQAAFPVEGLNIEQVNGRWFVTYRGVPLKDCAASEQIRIGMAIGMATNPKIRVLLVRDGSLLDQNLLAMLKDMAVNGGFQVWAEIVEEDPQGGFVIRDGGIISAPPKEG
jgi:energy-coupling factor transporter ATP-binding protein EcfA2